MKTWVRSIIVGLFCALGVTPAVASPAVYVTIEDGFAWWNSEITIRPMDKAIGGIPLKDLNSFPGLHSASADFCYVEPLSKDAIVSSSRKVQLEVNSTLNNIQYDPFLQKFQTDKGRKFVSMVGVYELCDGSKGAFVLTLDQDNNQIMDLDQREDSLIFLYPTAPGSIGAKSCFQCGEASTLYFDSDRNRMYWEVDGD
jgi:hypothetical protein